MENFILAAIIVNICLTAYGIWGRNIGKQDVPEVTAPPIMGPLTTPLDKRHAVCAKCGFVVAAFKTYIDGVYCANCRTIK